MLLEPYREFTRRLQARLEGDPRVLSLVALGSMAEAGRVPDAWSDHDFFVITVPGAQEGFRQDLAWLPDVEHVALRVRETAHGLKVLYDSGHVLEFAVFDEQEVFLAKVNDYRVLFDRSCVAESLARIQRESALQQVDLPRELELFLFHLLLGAARCARGEVLSGHRFIKTYALDELMTLLTRALPDASGVLDNLDPYRRFERASPELGARLRDVLLQEPVAAAREMLALAEGHLRSAMPAYPERAAEVVREYLKGLGSR
ncbi:MAG: hypothetical protein L0Y64_20130 [Myxococcaceae bacterium]|nr:hypothetical protein [Myxococcaceae bacterium]